MKQNILGVIGGLGPLATARFLELTVEMTNAASEQDNLDMIIYNFPSIPDRTGYILGSNLRSPLPGLLSAARALERDGAAYIAIPCVTAHYFADTLQSAVPVPIISILDETVRHLQENRIRSAGIMATDGTVFSGIFTKALKDAGIAPIHPSKQRQADVMHLIYENIKAGKPAELDRFRAVQAELTEKGAEVIILGCTELSVIKRDYPIGPGFLDTMEVLAQQAVLRCEKPLKQSFRRLISQ